MISEDPESQKNSASDDIPFPHLHSWMHKRISLPKETYDERLKRYKREDIWEQRIAALTSRLIKITHLYKGNRRWVFYKFGMKIVGLIYKIRNRMEVLGKNNIPKKGCIFIVNHIKGQDVVIPFLAAYQKPIGVFTSMGVGYFSDLVEFLFGFVTRRGKNSAMIEKMVRSIYKVNRFFVMWPEGTLERQGKIIQGFSGIVKVYATLNSQKNLIPFVPVYMTEASEHEKIIYKIFKPLFIPREWLKKPEEGGKTPREIIDYLMMIHARVRKQDKLYPNHVLEGRRKNHGKPWNE